MGLFSSLLRLGDPAGMAYSEIKGGSKSPTSAATPATSAQPTAADASYGNPNDPSYGSFTQPFDVTQFYNYADPGYAFQLQQGTQALQNSAAAGSGALSGSALKDLLKYNQDYAGTAYNDAFNRYQTQQGNIFSRLSSLAQLGQAGASGTAANGVSLAGQAGQAIQNAGSATGAGIVGGANALGGGLTNAYLMSQFSNSGGPQGYPTGVNTGLFDSSGHYNGNLPSQL